MDDICRNGLYWIIAAVDDGPLVSRLLYLDIAILQYLAFGEIVSDSYLLFVKFSHVGIVCVCVIQLCIRIDNSVGRISNTYDLMYLPAYLCKLMSLPCLLTYKVGLRYYSMLLKYSWETTFVLGAPGLVTYIQYTYIHGGRYNYATCSKAVHKLGETKRCIHLRLPKYDIQLHKRSLMHLHARSRSVRTKIYIGRV